MRDLDILDVPHWEHGDARLGNALNGGYVPLGQTAHIPILIALEPKEVRDAVSGNGTWTVEDGSLRLSSASLMSTNMVIVEL
jgi:hypothetical protein